METLQDTKEGGSIEVVSIQKEDGVGDGDFSSLGGGSEVEAAVVVVGDSSTAINAVAANKKTSNNQEILDAVDEDGNTALHVATWAGDLPKVTISLRYHY